MSRESIKIRENTFSNDTLIKNDMYGRISLNSCLTIGEKGESGQCTYVSKHSDEETETKLKINGIEENVIFEEGFDGEKIIENKDYILNVDDGTFILYKFIRKDGDDFIVEEIDKWKQTSKKEKNIVSEDISVGFTSNESTFNYGEINYYDNDDKYYILDSSISTSNKKKLGIFDCSIDISIIRESSTDASATIRTHLKCPSCGNVDHLIGAQQLNGVNPTGDGTSFRYRKIQNLTDRGYLGHPLSTVKCSSCGLLKRGVIFNNLTNIYVGENWLINAPATNTYDILYTNDDTFRVAYIPPGAERAESSEEPSIGGGPITGR